MVRRVLSICLVFFAVAVFVGALLVYPGDKLLYSFFSISLFAPLVDSIKTRKNFSYFFVAAFMWLGFWFKLAFHLIFPHQYVEPTGQFDFSPASYDGVLWIGIFVGLGVLAAGRVGAMFLRQNTMAIDHLRFGRDELYAKFRTSLFVVVLLGAGAFAVLNTIYGIQQIGLVPRTYLPWPTSAIFFWVSSTGFLVAVLVFLSWDKVSGKASCLGIVALLVESVFSSFSIYSRSVFIFHAVPAMIVLWKINYWSIRSDYRRFYIAFVMLLLGFLVSVSGVTAFRNLFYSTTEEAPPSLVRADEIVSTIARLATDRWIGIEGAMAIYSYDKKGPHTLISALMEEPSIGRVSFYQSVSGSSYQFQDTKRFIWATIPGAGGFFYYSESLVVVLLGLFFLTGFAIATEHFFHFLTKNPLISAWYGCWVGNFVAQFGVAPLQVLKPLLMTSLALVILAFLGRKLASSSPNKPTI